MPIKFREAMRRLGPTATAGELAARFGWRMWQIHQAMQNKPTPTRPLTPGPPGWETGLLVVARERAQDAADLVRELEAAVTEQEAKK